MVVIKIIKSFRDSQAENILRLAGSETIVDKERADDLIRKGFAEFVSEAIVDAETESKKPVAEKAVRSIKKNAKK